MYEKICLEIKFLTQKNPLDRLYNGEFLISNVCGDEKKLGCVKGSGGSAYDQFRFNDLGDGRIILIQHVDPF